MAQKKNTNVIDRVKQEIATKGLSNKTREARDWLVKRFKNLNVAPHSVLSFHANKISQDKNRSVSNTMIGNMYFYFYDAKTKDKLPYWDKFPLTIPIEEYPDGFLGLNLHYLDMQYRLALFDGLAKIKSNQTLDVKKQFVMSYQLLQRSKHIPLARPCLKRYLFDHIRSRFIEIPNDEWDIALFLPVEQFQKASKSKVWKESREKI